MKFAIKIIKNQFHPLKISDNANIKHGQYVLVKTDKGEEVFQVFLVNSEIQNLWEKHRPEALSVVRIMSEEDMKTYQEQKKQMIIYKAN